MFVYTFCLTKTIGIAHIILYLLKEYNLREIFHELTSSFVNLPLLSFTNKQTILIQALFVLVIQLVQVKNILGRKRKIQKYLTFRTGAKSNLKIKEGDKIHTPQTHKCLPTLLKVTMSDILYYGLS